MKMTAMKSINDDANRKRNWANFGFVKPLRALMDLSGFPLLTWMYKILVTLAITSSNAERSMSRARIIKNRLRTTMLDDWFSSLMIIAAVSCTCNLKLFKSVL